MSDDFTKNPWSDDDKENTRHPFLNSYNKTPRPAHETPKPAEATTAQVGDPAAVERLPAVLRNRLQPHWSNWALLTEEQARYRIADERTKFFVHRGRDRWDELRGPGGNLQKWVCLVRIQPGSKPKSAGGSGGGASSMTDGSLTNTMTADEASAVLQYRKSPGYATDRTLKLRYLDDQGEPVPDIRYTVTHLGQTYKGVMDEDGEAAIEFLAPGEATVVYEADHSKLPELRNAFKASIAAMIEERNDRKQMLDDLLNESGFVEKHLILTGAFMMAVWDTSVELTDFVVDSVTAVADGLGKASAALYNKLADGYSLAELQADFAYVVTEAGHAFDQARQAYTVLRWLATDAETWATLIELPRRLFDSMSTVEKVEALGALAMDIIFLIALAVATALTGGAAAVVVGSAAALKHSGHFTACIGSLRRIYRLLPKDAMNKQYRKISVQAPEQQQTGRYQTPVAELKQNETGTIVSESKTDTGKSTQSEAQSTTSGDPINMLTGEELFSHIDFELGGPLPLVWKRLYRSTASARRSDLGHGWSHPFDQSLTLTAGQLVHRDAEGANTTYELPASGQRVRNQWGTVVSRYDDRLSLQQEAGTWHFEPDPDEPERWRLSQFSTPDRQHHWQLHYAEAGETNTVNTTDGLPKQRLIHATSSWGAELHFHHGAHGWLRLRGRAQAQLPMRTLAHYRINRQGDLIAATDALGGLEQYRYDHHLFQLRRTATGLDFRFEWDAAGPSARCIRQYADTGEGDYYDYRFRWDPANRTSTATDGRGYTETFVFDAAGHLIDRTKQDGGREQWDYDSKSRLRAHTDPLGHVTRFEYDEHDRLIKRTDALGRTTELRYGSGDSHRPRQIIDPLGRQTAYRYNSDGQLTTLRHPDGTEERWAYQGDRPIAHRDHAGREHRYLWDDQSGQLARHLCLGISLADGRPWHGTPNAQRDNRLAPPDDWTVAKPLDDTKPTQKNQKTQKTQKTQEPDKNNGEADNDAAWLSHPRVTVLADTRFDYDDQGRLHTRTDRDGQRHHYQYDDHGRLITQVDEHNQAWRYEYDNAGRLIAQTDPGGRTTRLRYGAFAQPEAKILPNGQAIRYQYDAERNLAALINGNGQAHRFEYDGCERLIREIGVDGRTTDYRYNEAGHLTGLTEGPITADFERNALGQLIREQYLHADRPEAATWTEYQYSAVGQLIGARNEHAEHRFEYDLAGRLTLDRIRQDFLGHYHKIRAHQHDQRFEYSAFDRPVSIKHSAVTAKPQDHELSWLMYDSKHPGWEQHYQWDKQGRLDGLYLRLPQGLAGLDKHLTAVVRQRYNDQGQLAERRQGQHQLLWDYDPEHRLSRYQRVQLADPDRPMQDPKHTLIEARLQDRHYSFDDQGRISRINDRNRRQRRFFYDPIDQLTQVEERTPGGAPTVHEEHTDPAGNRLPEGLDQLLDNRLPFHGDRHFTYDEHGNLIRIQRGTDKRLEQRLSYNAKHQLIQLDDYKDGDLQQRLHFRYDALGRRIDKEVHRWQHPTYLPFGSGDWSDDEKDQYLKTQPRELSRAYTEAYIWQGQTLVQTRHIDRKYKPTNCRMYAYEPDSHVPVAMYDQQLGLHHIDTDHAGTPKALYSHETGEEVWSTDHEVYGKTRDIQSTQTHPITGLPFEPNLRLQGQYEDVETGLYQNLHRYYDPYCGRYVSQDPMGLSGGLNVYQYCPNPVGYVDPLGLCKEDCDTGSKLNSLLSADAPYLHRYDPAFPGRPDPQYSVDSTNFTNPVGYNAQGFPRDAGEFWRQWASLNPESLSSSNKYLIDNYSNLKVSPRVDEIWLKMFPEHGNYLKDVLIHHHVDHGRYTIPVPGKTHVGSGGPWHQK